MIPLTTLPSSEENTPIHYPRRRLVEQSLGYGAPACSNLPYGHQHQLIVRGTPRHGQYTTAAAHDYRLMPQAAVRRDHVEQEPVDNDDVDDAADWMDSCLRVLTCYGLCSWSAAPAAGGGKRLDPRCSVQT